jgi:hypothetical protein
LNLSTITDAGAEFALSGAAASGVTVNGAGTLVSGTTYRYSFTGSFTTGSVAVNFGAGSFADAAGNLNAALSQSFAVTAVAAFVRQYDFGTATSPLAAGYTQVTDTTGYSGGLGHGWLNGSRGSWDSGVGTSVTRDFVYINGSSTFAVDAPAGVYDVTVTLGNMGGASAANQTVTLEGVQVDSVSPASGQVVTRTYQVSVVDGQLTLLLNTSAIEELKVVKV